MRAAGSRGVFKSIVLWFLDVPDNVPKHLWPPWWWP